MHPHKVSQSRRRPTVSLLAGTSNINSIKYCTASSLPCTPYSIQTFFWLLTWSEFLSHVASIRASSIARFPTFEHWQSAFYDRLENSADLPQVRVWRILGCVHRDKPDCVVPFLDVSKTWPRWKHPAYTACVNARLLSHSVHLTPPFETGGLAISTTSIS